MPIVTLFTSSGPVDQALIDTFEHNKNIQFPRLYKEFISEHDGAIPLTCRYKFIQPEYQILNQACINFLSFKASNLGMDYYQQLLVDWGIDPLIVAFGVNSSGDFICFDYRQAPTLDKPYVVTVLHDDVDSAGKHKIYEVNQNFAEFFYRLEDDRENHEIEQLNQLRRSKNRPELIEWFSKAEIASITLM